MYTYIYLHMHKLDTSCVPDTVVPMGMSAMSKEAEHLSSGNLTESISTYIRRPCTFSILQGEHRKV